MAVANNLNLRVLPRGLVSVAAAFMLCVGLAAAAIAENRVNKVVPIEAVEAITLTGAAELIIRQGEAASLEVRAPVDVLANIKVEQADSRLMLGQKQSKSFWSWFGSKNESSDVTFIVTVKNLSALHVAGAARVRLDSLNSPQLMLELTGAAQMHIGNAVLERLQVNLTGAHPDFPVRHCSHQANAIHADRKTAAAIKAPAIISAPLHRRISRERTRRDRRGRARGMKAAARTRREWTDGRRGHR